jgi:hypothetical protein
MNMAQMRSEIHKLTALLLRKGQEFEDREKWLEEQHRAGKQNYSGDIGTVKRKDLLLADISGASKTIAAILNALSAAYLAEIEYRRSQSVTGVASGLRSGTPATVTMFDPPSAPGTYRMAPEEQAMLLARQQASINRERA